MAISETPVPVEPEEESYGSPVLFQVFGALFISIAFILYAYELSQMNTLFFTDLATDTFRILRQPNITVLSLAYIGILVKPTIAVMIGIGFIGLKKWLLQVLEIGFVIGALFQINNYVLSTKFGASYMNFYETGALLAVGLIMAYAIWHRRFFIH